MRVVAPELLWGSLLFALVTLPAGAQASVRGLSPSSGAATVLLSSVAILIGIGALVGATENFKGAGDGEHSAGKGLLILIIGAALTGYLAFVIFN